MFVIVQKRFAPSTVRVQFRQRVVVGWRLPVVTWREWALSIRSKHVYSWIFHQNWTKGDDGGRCYCTDMTESETERLTWLRHITQLTTAFGLYFHKPPPLSKATGGGAFALLPLSLLTGGGLLFNALVRNKTKLMTRKFDVKKLKTSPMVRCILYFGILNRLGVTHQCDGRTNEQTGVVFSNSNVKRVKTDLSI